MIIQLKLCCARCPGDDKVKRRLAQNREAARKSRQRRKAYVQSLEEEVYPDVFPACFLFLNPRFLDPRSTEALNASSVFWVKNCHHCT